MKDQVLIATEYEDTVRIYAALTTQTVETARQIHDTWPTATAALGRTLSGTLMMGLMNDNVYRLTVRFTGDGPLGEILAVSNEKGLVKGYVNEPHIDLELNELGKLDVAGAIGSGQITVIKDIGLKEPYHGIVPLQTGEIAEDLAYYFTKSEQTPSAVALGVLIEPDGSVKTAGGFMIQLMPGATEDTSLYLEKRLSEIPPVSNLLSQSQKSIDIIIGVLGEEIPVKILEEIEVGFRCDCSSEKFKGPLLSLGNDELQEILVERGEIEVKCHFCNKVYHYRDSDLGGVEC